MQVCCKHSDTLQDFELYYKLFFELAGSETQILATLLYDIQVVRQSKRGNTTDQLRSMQQFSNRSLRQLRWSTGLLFGNCVDWLQ